MNTPPFALLRLLADREFHSGTSLGRALGLSRGAIWYQVRAIEALGLRIFKVRGRGYCLAAPLDLLDADSVRALLPRSFPRSSRDTSPLVLELLDECASTNSLAMERARQGARSGLVLACELQTAGRGRLGSIWHSGLGTGLTFSLLWRFAAGAAALSGLSLAVGVAMVRALKRHAIEGVSLKWPNDLLARGAKLGGILIEVSGDSLGPCAVVVGIGINVRLSASLGGKIDQAATDLAACAGSLPARSALLATALDELSLAMMQFDQHGFEAFRAEWQSHHAHQGKRVELRLNQQCVAEGEALGVASDGALMLRSARGLERFHAGEVSLRTGA